MASRPTYYWDACLFYEVLGDEIVTPQKKARAATGDVSVVG